MIQLNNKEIRYSLLIAGAQLDTEKIKDFLEDGIKVIWFGNEKDNKRLESEFQDYIKHMFLCVYSNAKNVKLVIIDGIGIEDYRNYLEKLEAGDIRFNLKQYEIEHNGGEPIVVVQAGAGSGKTFVMNNRLLYLLHTQDDFHFSDVLMVTFTNEATDSMRRKLIELLNNKLTITRNIKYLKWIEEVPQISISTIHSFFRKVIIEIGPLLGYGTNLRMSGMIMEKKSILRDILNERYMSEDGSVKDVLGLPVYDIEKMALSFWRKIENNGMSETDVFSMDWGIAGSEEAEKIQGTLLNVFEEVEERYNTYKMENNAIEMSDIIHEFSRVVNNPRVKEFITSKYKYLFCDEFQDSDDVQIQTIAVLDKIYNGNLFVVGDIKQSIYRFRGATDSAFERLNLNISRELGEEYLREPFSLAKNYRTSGEILTELDGIFRVWGDKGYLKYNYKGKSKDVLIPQVSEPGIYKQIRINRNSEREDKFDALLEIIDGEIGTQKKSIMVLARYNWQLRKVKEWCDKAHRACLIRKKGSFYTSPTVKEFCALLEALLYYAEPMYLFNFVRTAYCYKTIDTDELELFNGAKSKQLHYFQNLIKENYEWDELIEKLRNRPVMSVLCEIIDNIKPSIRYGAIQRQKYILSGYTYEEGTKQAVLDAKQYELDLQKLLQILATSFSGEFSTLLDICSFIRIKMNTDREENQAEIDDAGGINYIQGSTVHGAKGLEFDYVVLPFMNDEFGKDNRSEILIDKTTRKVGWQYKKNKSDEGIHNTNYELLQKEELKEVIGDETRLLYVAMTRPISGLYCFTEKKRNKNIVSNWSDLLPEDKDDANYL